MDRKKLLEDAEQFIIHNDEEANVVIDGAIKRGAEFIADFAEKIVNNLDNADVSPRLFYVVAESHTEEGNWEQISNGFEDYSKAKLYRDGSFCKGRWPNAFIVASLNEG